MLFILMDTFHFHIFTQAWFLSLTGGNLVIHRLIHCEILPVRLYLETESANLACDFLLTENLLQKPTLSSINDKF